MVNVFAMVLCFMMVSFSSRNLSREEVILTAPPFAGTGGNGCQKRSRV